ncbi:hypothetical protein TDE_1809 [Treponema denticola ATCC 35405]|uniref:Uncharacterized protein n=1 Tax=Treponema denticola (strain ATCC 35405 / DSM 14222 / CIP 103919 / JCM 8153 / KCTC 15104) TaxID=243275 RepID=Q73LQ3_TREDE|nr:hypothetical protein TDE_1809 [Treponema denticola ATCC 35405]
MDMKIIKLYIKILSFLFIKYCNKKLNSVKLKA